MSRTITVKGTGKVTAKPDLVTIRMELETIDKNYSKATELASEKIKYITDVVVFAGFKKSDLKTRNFSVNSEYRSETDKNGNYRKVFIGYRVSHSLSISFDFDSDRLSHALEAIGSSEANSDFSIQFSVKDISAARNELLRRATVSGRQNAETICEASGVKLGQLLSIDYSWAEADIYSPTSYRSSKIASLSEDIEPEDVSLSDTITFVWEIE